MNKYGEVTLCTKSKTLDSIGQEIVSATVTQTIQCTVKSIGRSEFISARQIGYDPEVETDVFSASYNGEPLAEYNGTIYHIYRTYQSGDTTELYLGKKIGDESEQQ